MAVLGTAAAVAERASVQLDRGVAMESSISNLLVLFAAVVFGPLGAMVVGGASMLGAFRAPYLKWGTYTLTRALQRCLDGSCRWPGGAAQQRDIDVGVIALPSPFGGHRARAHRPGLWLPHLLAFEGTSRSDTYACPLAGHLGLSTALHAARRAARHRLRARFAADAAAVPRAGARRSQALSPLSRPATARGRSRLVNQRLERANLSFATALVATLDARDRYTAGHSAAVAIYARDIAERLGLTRGRTTAGPSLRAGSRHREDRTSRRAARKARGPDARRAPQMQEHSAIGERILAKVEDYAEIAKIVRHHHERIDGMGYPRWDRWR